MKAEIKGKFVFLFRGASYISRRQAGNIVKAERKGKPRFTFPRRLCQCQILQFLIIVVSQNVILSVKTRLLPDKLFISNNLSVKPHLFTDKLSILSQPYSVSVIRAYMIKTVRGPQRFSNRFLLRSRRRCIKPAFL